MSPLAIGCTIKAKGDYNMSGNVGAGYAGYGMFGGFTRWAIVFLIIFVLFFLLVPGHY